MNDLSIKHQLHDIGIKNTPKKAVILESLRDCSSPITANELHQKCSQKTPMDIATVYRTLQQFKQKGVVREFLGNDGTVNYEYVVANVPAHPHFQCEKCQGLICLDALGFDDALYFSNMAGRHQIHSISITLSGVCEECQS